MAKFQRDCLPVAVQNDQVQAEFKDGILTLTLPKINEARKVVKVNLADKNAATTGAKSEPAAEANHTEASPSAEPATV